MQPDDTERIPVYALDGSVLCHATVDAADAEWVNQWRWTLDKGGYVVPLRPVSLHRMLGGRSPGDGLHVDHIDRDPLNNRRNNLRPATRAENMQNTRSRQGSMSTYRGVSWDKGKGKWRARITVNNKTVTIGRFDVEEEAAEAARAARVRLMPFSVD